MRNLIEWFFRITESKLRFERNSISPKTWAGFIAEFNLQFAAVYGVIIAAVALALNLLLLGEYIFISTLLFGVAGFVWYFFSASSEDEDIKILPGSIGIILIMGEIYGRKLQRFAKEGIYKRSLKLPFLGEIFSIVHQEIYFNNIDIHFTDVPSADGELFEGDVSVEIEMVDPYKTYELVSVADEGFIGRIEEKVLELMNLSFQNLTVEQIIKSGQQEPGVSVLRKAFDEAVEGMKSNRSACFQEPKKLFNGQHTHNADVFFDDAGMNLKFILKRNVPVNRELLKAYTNINIAQAGKQEAKAKKKVTIINANAEAERIKIEGNAQVDVEDRKDQIKMERFEKMVSGQLSKIDGITREEAENNARLLINAYSNEQIVAISNADGSKLESFAGQAAGLIAAALKK